MAVMLLHWEAKSGMVHSNYGLNTSLAAETV